VFYVVMKQLVAVPPPALEPSQEAPAP